MTLTKTETQFLNIAKAAISGTEISTDAVDWTAIFTLSNQQKLLPIIFEAVRQTDAARENAALFAAVKQQVISQVLNQVVRSAEFADLYKRLRVAGLHPVLVKGALCSRLYPLKDHRISADDDIYVQDSEFLDCHEQLLAEELTTDTPADELPTADEVSYLKEGSPLYIELHRHLFDSSEDAHDELNHFFADIQPIEMAGFLAMPLHEHLLYLILHCGGVYGSNDYTRLHSSTVTLNTVKASRVGERSSILSSIFPKKEYLERRYQYLKKHPYLLPVAWIQRIVNYAMEKRASADNSAAGAIKLAKERIELMKMYDIID